MYDHLGIKVRDLKTSLRFYEAALSALGHVLASQGDDYAGLGPRDEPALWLYRGKASSGAHIAFRAANRAAVDAFYQQGLKAGGRDNGAPGLRTDYSPRYYAAFLLDPDGNNVEAVCIR